MVAPQGCRESEKGSGRSSLSTTWLRLKDMLSFSLWLPVSAIMVMVVLVVVAVLVLLVLIYEEINVKVKARAKIKVTQVATLDKWKYGAS